MHQRSQHQPDGQAPTDRLWLLAGTGEGPPLAAALLAAGWQLRVSVVSPEAARSYPTDPRLQLQVGPLADAAAVEQVLQELRPRWVIDATHPFAVQISALLEQVLAPRQQPRLRLARAAVSRGGERLQRLDGLRRLDLRGERLLLAIGSRHLPAALAASNAAAHFARVLDRPASLQLALAAGLPDAHLACLRPDSTGGGRLERALCRRWRISAVLCRQSGGSGEALWQELSRDLGLRLLLLERPPEPGSAEALPLRALLEKLGRP
ncbi:MAG: precorrin-6A/cobalt-precorrin-6A reductase [Vulcanococcus sp.]